MTGYGSVVNAAKVKAGSRVVVIGAGGVGLNVVQGARILGAIKITAVDINNNRLQMAKEYGAIHTLIADEQDSGLKAAKQIRT
jgi:S-(hydroxymethyl)glutathione dehydrogenase/alcohol dehydrogenase